MLRSGAQTIFHGGSLRPWSAPLLCGTEVFVEYCQGHRQTASCVDGGSDVGSREYVGISKFGATPQFRILEAAFHIDRCAHVRPSVS